MMRKVVMEGGWGGSRTARSSSPVHQLWVAGALMAVLGAVPNTVAQDAKTKTPFRAIVVDTSQVTQRISVPVNRSAIVETSVELARADVIASEIADVQTVSPTELLVRGKSFGQTHVILWDKDEQQYVLEVSVELDLQQLNDAMKAIDPLSHVQARSVLGNVVLTGTVSSPERAKRMTHLADLFLPRMQGGEPATAVQNHLDVVGEQQVLIRCVVAEMSRSAMRELAVNGFLAGENFKDAFIVQQLGGLNPINIGAAADALVTRNVPFLTGEDGIPISDTTNLSLGLPRGQAQLFIRALADNSLGSVLAEPNLVAISGETASFLAGGEFPIPVPQGNQQVTIQFREFGVRLNFSPIVLGHGRIRMRVAPEVSELDFGSAVQIEGFVVPGLRSRATETTVEVGDGQTLAIAGLLSEQVRGVASRIPGMGDIPVLGALFRSVNFQRNLTELVILVTPEVVAPLDVHQPVTLPTDGRTDPNDLELYLMSMLEGGKVADSTETPDDDVVVEEVSLTAVSTAPEQLTFHGPWGHAAVTE